MPVCEAGDLPCENLYSIGPVSHPSQGSRITPPQTAPTLQPAPTHPLHPTLPQSTGGGAGRARYPRNFWCRHCNQPTCNTPAHPSQRPTCTPCRRRLRNQQGVPERFWCQHCNVPTGNPPRNSSEQPTCKQCRGRLWL